MMEKWSRSEKEKTFFKRRYIVIKELDWYALERGISIQSVVNKAERRRLQRNCTLVIKSI